MTAITIRSKMVEIKGARVKRLSCHNAWNSTEWFFFMIMARKKGAMQTIVKTVPARLAQKTGRLARNNGIIKWNESVIIAIHNTE